MPIALGLDAGGTYTDAVLFDLDTNRILASAKSPTSPPTYIDGVARAVDALPGDLRRQAGFVALSTTLATNAIVEGRHAPAGLVLIGYDEHEAKLVRWTPRRIVPGRHTIRGVETEPFDEAAFRTALDELVKEGVQGIAISSILSVRNPDHERRAAAIARETTKLPLVCGSEVAGVLNAIVRAETAALNAGLIPLIHRFVDAVESVLADAGLRGVPCHMVTGDGSLMATSAARIRPVETVLSGPACSALGAARLAGVEDGIVVDIGGTTTDIAVLAGGSPRMAAKGVSVGPWHAGVRSAQVVTRGLGGDSEVRVEHGRVTVGPRRVVPVSSIGSRFAELSGALAGLRDRVLDGRPPGGDWRLTSPADVFLRMPLDPPAPLDEQETAILEALDERPLTREELGAKVRYPHLSILRTGRLEQWGLIERAGLTPTDLWHVTGEYTPWDTKAAQAATDLVAQQLGGSVEDLITRVRETAVQALVRQVTEAHLGVETGPNGVPDHTLAGRLTQIVLGELPREDMTTSIAIAPPIVGVGAPAHLFLRPVVERLGGRLVVPEGAPVANAVGAATGAVVAASSALIRPQEDGSMLCYGPTARASFPTRQEAVEWAREQLVPVVREDLARRGAVSPVIEVAVEHHGTEVKDVADPVWWETAVVARGVGRPVAGASEKHAAEVRVVESWDMPGLKEAEERAAETI